MSPMVDRRVLARWMAKYWHIWQMDLLTPAELSSYASYRGLTFWSSHVRELWEAGLLRADLVVVDGKFNRPGFSYVGHDSDGQRLYADERQMGPLPEGWSVEHPTSSGLGAAALLFHPFRYYVLFHLSQMLDPAIVPIMTLRPAERYQTLLGETLSEIKQPSNFLLVMEDLEKYQDVASLCVAAEPYAFTRVFGVLKTPLPITRETQSRVLTGYRHKVANLFTRIGAIERTHLDLCRDVHIVEPNEDVHTLLTLGHGEERLKLRGRLGGAMLVRGMAEILRRTAEDVFDKDLPEEDEHLGRLGARCAKEKLFGSRRLLDGDWRAADEFARTFGLRYGHHLRWYVEGKTEYFALRHILEKLYASDITVIDLLVRVAEKGHSAFRQSLDADIDARIFSFVSIDGDVSENVKVVKKSARDDVLCGAFFISRPNFECANFSPEELEQLVWKLAKAEGATDEQYETFMSGIVGWDKVNCKLDDLFRRSEAALGLHGTPAKGEAWGKVLIEYAWENQTHPSGQTREVITAIYSVFRARHTNYHLNRTKYRVDENSGRMVPR
jgi:hypothetical protein